VPTVQVLPDALVNQIAAGEVIERPASVVKELVENALDAGARRVTVDVDGGGVHRIEVVDDGIGMGPEDAQLAMERHATSKIRSFEDLTRIGTLGFRGEALPSIASVSRLSLSTSPDGSGLGTVVGAVRGAKPKPAPTRHPKGTRVLVEDLFGNVPARRKFLKSPEAELRAIVKTLTAQALARPDVAFVLRSGPRTLLDLPPAPAAAARFLDVLGGAAGGALLPVSFTYAGMTLTGSVTPPDVTFPSRVNQWFFVNGRVAKDGSVSHAAALAAREILRSDRHPAFALFLGCDPALCDVNVHPRKLEVRFKDASSVHSLVHRGLAAALGGGKSATGIPASSWRGSFVKVPAGSFSSMKSGPGGAASAIAEAIGVYGDASLAPFEVQLSRAAYPGGTPSASPVGRLSLLGQYRESFLVAEGEHGIVLVDQHVAHERVRYERILARLEGTGTPSQRLLLPLTFDATPDEAELLVRADALLAAAGFVVSELSGRTFVISSASADTGAGAVEPFLREFLSRLAALPEGAETGAARAREALAASLACRGAITINTPLAAAEATRLLADLSACRDPFTCPHGRPILLTFSHEELEKRFGRRS
jgi:DNA mismatch repair protein MutL